MTTKDIYFAAVLLCYGYDLLDVINTDPKHQEFIFDGDEHQIRGLQMEYANQRLNVNAWHFKEALQRMKFIVYNGRN